MNDKQIKILAIETSCDETSAAVICEENQIHSDQPTANRQPPTIVSNIVSSQVDLHAKTSGVVPEVASRAHMEAIIPVVEKALLQENTKSEIRNTKQTQKYNVLNIKNSDSNIVSNFDIGASDLLQEVTHLAVTAGPGLIGSLLVGFNTAKSLAYALNIPIIPINHIEGHIYSALCGENPKSEYRNSKQHQNNKDRKTQEISNFVLRALNFPILALTVSGGHTSLTLMKDHGVYENIGATIDDAAGEAFDKVAKLLDLGYPGGPIVSRYAKKYREKISNSKFLISNQITNPESTSSQNQCHSVEENPADSAGRCGGDLNIKFPRPLLDRPDFNFSFSGLKTSVLYTVKKLTVNSQPLTAELKQQICYEFEEAVVDVLVTKTMRAAMQYEPKIIILAGGVSANLFLRKRLTEELKNHKTKEHDCIELLLPPLELCGDNAAMIGLAAYYHIIRDDISSWDKIKVDSNLKL